MAKPGGTKKRNRAAQDTTLINLRAIKRAVEYQAGVIARLAARVRKLEAKR